MSAFEGYSQRSKTATSLSSDDDGSVGLEGGLKVLEGRSLGRSDLGESD